MLFDKSQILIANYTNKHGMPSDVFTFCEAGLFGKERDSKVSTWGRDGVFFVKFSYKVVNKKERLGCVIFKCIDGLYIAANTKSIDHINNIQIFENLLAEITWFAKNTKQCENSVGFPSENNIKKRSVGKSIYRFRQMCISDKYATDIDTVIKIDGNIQDPTTKLSIVSKVKFIYNHQIHIATCEVDIANKKLFLEGSEGKKEYTFTNQDRVIESISSQFYDYLNDKADGYKTE